MTASKNWGKCNTIDIRNTTKTTLPRVPFCDIKKTILGKEYVLSLVFVGDTRSRALNKTYRNKDKPTNILSFPLSDTSGEIFINLNLCKKEASKFERSFDNFIAFLFIHGLFHLKGYDHGSTMERKEKNIRTTFNI